LGSDPVFVEPGNHVLPDGSRIMVLEHSTTSFANRLISTIWGLVRFPSIFPGTPAIVAQMQTMANESGNPPATSSIPFMDDGGWVRQCSQAAGPLGLTVDEDSDNDSERNHTTESAGIIATSTAFHTNFDVDLLISKNVATRNDPFNGSRNPKAIPGADVEYRIGVVNSGSSSPDTNTLTIVSNGVRAQ